MTRIAYKKHQHRKRDSENTFFLYVAFHSAWTAVMKFLDHD
jgi:hypothetical protein